MAGTTTKFSQEVVDVITKEIAETGAESLGYTAAGIAKPTYFRWKRNKPEFKAQVDGALAEFRKNQQGILRNQVQAAKDYLARSLTGEQYVEEIITRERGGVIEVETKRKQVQPPQWWLQKLLDDNEDTSAEVTIKISRASPAEEDEQDEYEDEFEDE